MVTGAAAASWRELYPFASHFHAVGPYRLHTIDEGEGDPVLMVHGNPTWSFYYRRVAAALRGTYRVVVPDHIGCGLSDKPSAYAYTLATHTDNLEHLVEALGLERITLVVHDWGGAIGMGVAVRQPERFARLVVLNTAAFPSPRIPLRINVCRIPGFGALAIRGANAFARGALHMAVAHGDRLTPAVRAGYLHPYGRWADRVALLRFVQDIPRGPGHPSYGALCAVAEGLAALRGLPMLIQWGALDWCFDATFLAEWRARFPEAEVDVYDDAGHYVLEDAHERILPRLGAFLEAHPR